MKANVAVFLALCAVASRSEAVVRCSGTPPKTVTATSGRPFTIPVTPIEGATSYDVQRASSWSRALSAGDFAPLEGTITTSRVRIDPGADAQITDTIFSTEAPQTTLYYVVTVRNADAARTCAQDFFVSVEADESLTFDARRLVVPVAGSLTGANGSVFRTRVILENPSVNTLEGMLVFYGTRDGKSDILRYRLEPMRRVVYDDVVAAMGLTGLGSLDVKPDPSPNGYPAPTVTVELQSLAPSGGSYGTDVPTISMADREYGALWTAFEKPMLHVGNTTTHRHNLGIRTLSDEVRLTAALFTAQGVLKNVVERHFPPDYHEQSPLASFFDAGVAEGDVLTFDAERVKSSARGGAILYVASTDNLTNDVRLEIPRPPQQPLYNPAVLCTPLYCRDLK